MSRLTRDGTAEPVSRDQIFRYTRGQGNIIFPVQLTTSRIGDLRACINVLIESVHKSCRQHLSKIKLCDWPNKLDATSWQVLNTTESVLAFIFFCQ